MLNRTIQDLPAARKADEAARARKWASHAADKDFDKLHGGRALLPIEQAIYESEGAERFARFHPAWAKAQGAPHE